jgi:hypothetical protein
MSVRAKFKVQSITSYESCSEVKLVAVYGDNNPENKAFFTATPSASINLTVMKPEVAARFKVGAAFYVDFTEAEPAPAA